MDTTFIYVLIDPRTNEVRYVGKANDPKQRLRKHIFDSSRSQETHAKTWINSLLKNGLRPALEVIEKCGDDWSVRETYWIKYYKDLGVDLTNATDGGEGIRPNEDARRKMSLAHIGKKPSDEQRRKMSLSGGSRLGIKHTFETKEKMKNAVRRKGKGKSRYFGVSYNTRLNKWLANVSIRKGNGYDRRYIGSFEIEVDAAKAYDKYILNHSLSKTINFDK